MKMAKFILILLMISLGACTHGTQKGESPRNPSSTGDVGSVANGIKAESLFRTIVDSHEDSADSCGHTCVVNALCDYNRLDRPPKDRVHCLINQNLAVKGEQAKDLFRAILEANEESSDKCTANTCVLRAKCSYNQFSNLGDRFSCQIQ